MLRIVFILVTLFFAATAVSVSLNNNPAPVVPASSEPTGAIQSAVNYDDAGFREGEVGLTPSERAGREIWYKAAAGNDRFHTYVFQQRIGVLIDWFRVLQSAARNDRFKAWGLINDPSCCQPGSPNCPAKSYEETYGFDWCPGDEALLKFVGKQGYRDPACDFKDAPAATDNPHAGKAESACNLAFGTSTGALGLRKFPNPLFDPDKWRLLNGGKMGSWEGYNKNLSTDPANPSAKASRLGDGSIQPPFRIGLACGACHIAFDPLKPPQDPAHPRWENIRGAIGNQYTRISEVLVSGMTPNTLEWQVFSHARPGTSDTSAVPTDQINNPGTINALINVKQRPVFANEDVNKWRKVNTCAAQEAQTVCWCEPGKPGKCWRKGAQQDTVHHILKDGGDSIGIQEALQRVFINIGSCSEQCWVNHLTDLRQLDPQQRGFGQTQFNIGQCRRDCPNFRAVEDRLPDVVNFLLSSEASATDLQAARANTLKAKDPQARYESIDLVEDLEKEFGKQAVTRGKTVFANNCARCHSSQAGPFNEASDFRAINAKSGLRDDWLGNDQATKVSEVGTFRCRALHSNHMTGHVWEEYASLTHRAGTGDPLVKERTDGGRGYYRNISLVNLWAHAPFMHNNALGPEICGNPSDKRNDFYRNSYVDEDAKMLSQPPACWAYDPSVEGRYALYKASMMDLLNPSRRVKKITKLDVDIPLDFGPKLWDGEEEKKLFGFSLTIPKGTNAGLLGNFQHKPFIIDLVLAKRHPDELQAKFAKQLGTAKGKEAADQMRQIADEVIKSPSQLLQSVRKRMPLILDIYSSCTADVENDGHRFGEDLSDQDKKALTAFLATL